MTASRSQWDSLARIWEQCEPFGLRWEHLAGYRNFLGSPCLVVGSGLGLLVEGLGSTGSISTMGVDHSVEMARRARELRGTATIVAALPDLPFRGGSFRSVICATGVLDPTHADQFRKHCAELIRMVELGGTLLLGLFQPSAEVLKITSLLGIMQHSRQHNDRLLTLWNFRYDLAEQVRSIASWTGCRTQDAENRLLRYKYFLSGWFNVYSGLADALRNECDAPEAFLTENFCWSLGAISSTATAADLLPKELELLSSDLFQDVSTRVDLYRIQRNNVF